MSKIEDIKRDWNLFPLYEKLKRKYKNEKLARFLTVRLAKMVRETGDLCIDNVRVANLSRPAEIKRYEEALANGC